jgi:hypothetical protein
VAYKDYLPSIAPPWLQGPIGKKFWQSVGQVMDAHRARITDGTKARFPGYAATDSLDAIGADRQLPRALGESDEDYAARLEAAWTTWGEHPEEGGGAGSHLALLRQLAAHGFVMGATGTTIVQQNGRYSQLDGSGDLVLGTLMECVNRMDLTGAVPGDTPGWTFDGRPDFYSMFGILFPDNQGFELPLLNRLVEKWKPAKALYIGAWRIVTGTLLGWPPTGRTLGTEPNLGGNSMLYHLPASGDNRIGYSIA